VIPTGGGGGFDPLGILGAVGGEIAAPWRATPAALGSVLETLNIPFEQGRRHVAEPMAAFGERGGLIGALGGPRELFPLPDWLEAVTKEVATEVYNPANLLLLPGVAGGLVKSPFAALRGGLGFAEKTRPGARVSLAARRVPAVVGAAEKPPEPVADKLLRLITEAKRAHPRAAGELHVRRVREAGAIAGIRGRQAFPEEEAFRKAMAQRAGKQPKPTLEMEEFGPEQVAELREVLRASPKLSPHDWPTARVALDSLLLGELPTPSEVALLERVYPGIRKTIEPWRPLGAKAWREFVEAANLPRAVLSSYDLSAPFRQGALLGPGHPKEFIAAFKPMIKALTRERNATASYEGIVNHPVYRQFAEPAGLYIAPIGSAEMAAREEAFMSKWAGKIPGVKQSQQAFVTFLNKLRFDVFKTSVQSWQRRGIPFTEADTKALASWVNIASGRGKLGSFERAGPELATILFSPRLLAARLETLPQLVTATPLVRKMVARDIAAFVGTNISLLSMLKLSGVADVELDPRSTDWGKIRVGATRIDPWAGFQQIGRTVAQLVMGVRKATVTGSLYPAERWKTLTRAGQAKLAPGFGFLVDVMRQSTFIGEEIDFSGAGIKAQAFNRLVPMFIQDVVDAVREQGVAGAGLAAPGLVGVGILSYETAFHELHNARNAAAVRATGLSFDDLAEREGRPEALRIVGEDSAVQQAGLAVEEQKQRWTGPPSGYDAIRAAGETYNAALAQTEPRFLENPVEANEMLRGARENKIAAIFNAEKTFPEIAEERDEYEPPDTPLSEWTPQEVFEHEMSLYWQHTDRESGLVLPEQRDTLFGAVDAFETTLSDEQYQQLQKNLGAKDTPVMALRRRDLGLLDEPKIKLPGVSKRVSYFDMSEVIWEKLRDRNWSQLGDISYREFKRELIAKHPELPPGDVLQRSDVVKAADAKITEYRQRIEEQVPELLGVLLAWGLRVNARDEVLESALPHRDRIRAEIQAALGTP
jgi:hypothetical protein